MEEKNSDLDFEISFYENLLKKKPDFIQALIALGDAYTKRGFYQKGLEIDKRLIQLKPDDPTVFYNLACSYSLLGLLDEALQTLKKAIKLGYRDFKWLKKEPDLENLRRTPEYNLIIKGLCKKKLDI